MGFLRQHQIDEEMMNDMLAAGIMAFQKRGGFEQIFQPPIERQIDPLRRPLRRMSRQIAECVIERHCCQQRDHEADSSESLTQPV